MGATIKLKIEAKKASLQPPIGPILGQYGISRSKFCQEFNEETRKYEEGVVLSVKIKMYKKKVINISKNNNITKILQRLYGGLVYGEELEGREMNYNERLMNLIEVRGKVKSLKYKLVANKNRKSVWKELTGVENRVFIEDIYGCALRYYNLKRRKGINEVKIMVSSLSSREVNIISKK